MDLPITFKLMPIAILLGITIILLSVSLLYRVNKYAAKELIAAGIVIIILAATVLYMHLRIMMLTTIESFAVLITIIAFPLGIAVLRSLSHAKKYRRTAIK